VHFLFTSVMIGDKDESQNSNYPHLYWPRGGSKKTMEERNSLNGQNSSRSVECFLDRLMRHLRQSIGKACFQRYASIGGAARTSAIVLFFLLVALPIFQAGALDLCHAADTIPGESKAGFFYTITHLHPAAYFILFLTFVLSVVNLIYQAKSGTVDWLGLGQTDRSGLSGIFRPSPEPQYGDRSSPTGSRPAETGPATSCGPSAIDRPPETIIGVRKVELNDKLQDRLPTPMDGVDHALPLAASDSAVDTGIPRIVEGEPQTQQQRTRFRFSSAVELPSPEELERRDKEKLVVSGVVQERTGKAIPSVMVYLTDENGKRVGQSCRSQPDTGEFTVMINEPGQYKLNGHKRGLVMDGEPLDLPIESGKIEGYSVRMIPEGCLVQGRVVDEAGAEALPDLEVKCVCPTAGFEHSVVSDEDGEFEVLHVPHNNDCYLEVRQSDGNVLARSVQFQTAHRREYFQELRVLPVPSEEDPAPESEMDTATAWLDEEQMEDEPSEVAPLGPMDHT
jgi:hypothetical protein